MGGLAPGGGRRGHVALRESGGTGEGGVKVEGGVGDARGVLRPYEADKATETDAGVVAKAVKAVRAESLVGVLDGLPGEGLVTHCRAGGGEGGGGGGSEKEEGRGGDSFLAGDKMSMWGLDGQHGCRLCIFLRVVCV